MNLAMIENGFTSLARRVHQDNVAAGWWSNPATGESILATRPRGEIIALIHSEISEGFDGFHDDLMDDHLPHRSMFEVELADAVIRILDLAGADDFDLDGTMRDVEAADYGKLSVTNFMTPIYNIGLIHADLSRALEGYRKGRPHSVLTHRRTEEVEITVALMRIMALAKERGFDLRSAVEEKRAYNRKRADHKIENRRQAGGKKF